MDNLWATKQQGMWLKGAEHGKSGCEHHMPLTHLSHFYIHTI
jgi:hypothetical protein